MWNMLTFLTYGFLGFLYDADALEVPWFIPCLFVLVAPVLVADVEFLHGASLC